MKGLKIYFDKERGENINLYSKKTNPTESVDKNIMNLVAEVLCGAEIGFRENFKENPLVSIEKKENYILIKIDEFQIGESNLEIL